MTRPTRADVDLEALVANLQRARTAAPCSRVAAVVKADAYGHGLVPVARALEASVDRLAVACLEEAARLHGAGIGRPSLLLEGVFEAAELAEAAVLGAAVVVHCEEQLAALERAGLTRPVEVWLKVDTGMHRLGWPAEDVPAIWPRLRACPAVGDVVLMSHLASADRPGDACNAAQLDRFDSATHGLEAERSMANSAAVLSRPEAHGDWVRPGIMLYGASPLAGRTASELGLEPVMTLRSRLIAVRQCRAGDRVGYGGDWVCPEAMPVGVVAIGYGDGYPRHLPAGTPVLVGDRRLPLIGRVSMDMITIDLRGRPETRPGDGVVLWGAGLPVDEIAARAGTIAYELLCQVTPRVPRIYHR